MSTMITSILCANFKNEFVFEFQKVACNQISKIESLERYITKQKMTAEFVVSSFVVCGDPKTHACWGDGTVQVRSVCAYPSILGLVMRIV